jgi:7,8-dihydropterin-6-yl-methyl-4-(beta-D-ribofuranosyl)aminobenzene 5'-phosphate synthase
MGRGTIRVVVDNRAALGLTAEHGFALWIEVGERVILFDTGNRDALAANLAKLGLDLSRVSDLVLSHGHYDHSGGIEAVLAKAPGLAVYLHQAALQPRYVAGEDGEDGTRSVRMSAGAMQAIGRLKERSVTWLTHPVFIDDHIGVSGPIPRRTEFENTGGKFFYDPWGRRPDPIEDDNAIWFETDQGLVICVGCSHAGIVNTLNRIVEISGNKDIDTVIGGLHLLHASPRRLEKTVSALNRRYLRRLVACHCTGEGATAFLADRLNCEVIAGYAGFELSF